MKKNKEIYSQPTSKLLVVRFEKRILQESNLVRGNGFSDSNADLDDQSDANWWE